MIYRDADEVDSFGAEASVPTSRLWSLLEYLGISTNPRYRIKEVSHPGWEEFKAITEILLGCRVLCRHQGPAFGAARSDVVADANWKAITLWFCSNKSQL
jgi:hypothetical protein